MLESDNMIMCTISVGLNFDMCNMLVELIELCKF